MELVPAPNGFTCPTDPGEPGLGIKRWSVSDLEARIAAEFCCNREVLEIGTGLGVATRAIAQKARMVHTVDIDPWVKQNVELPDNAIFYDDIRDVPEGLDVAFIDGLHTTEQCLLDIEEAKRIIKPGGLLIFHDARMQQVMKAIQDLHPVFIVTPAGVAIAWS